MTEIVFTQIVILFSFILVGYVLGKSGKVGQKEGKTLSTLCVYVFMPCMNFLSFATNCTVENLKANSSLVLAAVLIVAALSLSMLFVSRLFTKDPDKRCVYHYTLTVPNYGYMGYPLVEGILGATGLFMFQIFTLPLALYTYSVGYAELTDGKLSFKRIVNPATVSIAAGMIVGLSGISLPTIVSSILSKGSACVGPVSMLLAGITLAGFSLKTLLADRNSYIITAIRLLAIPFAVGLLLPLLTKDQSLITMAVLFAALPCGLNTIVLPSLAGKSCDDGARFAFLSNILACGTLPLCVALLL